MYIVNRNLLIKESDDLVRNEFFLLVIQRLISSASCVIVLKSLQTASKSCIVLFKHVQMASVK